MTLTHGVGVDVGHGRGVATTEEGGAESEEVCVGWNDACFAERGYRWEREMSGVVVQVRRDVTTRADNRQSPGGEDRRKCHVIVCDYDACTQRMEAASR